MLLGQCLGKIRGLNLGVGCCRRGVLERAGQRCGEPSLNLGRNNENRQRKKEEVSRKWYVVDASEKTLGRLSTEIANRLRGKHKASFTPHVDTGDYIIVVNAEKVRVTGRKTTDKTYYHHTGFPGGIKSITFDKLIDKAPERVIETAVKGMMPKNKLSRAMLTKLKVYAGSNHPHAAQQPEVLEL